jgi:hypothetical protein
MTIHNPLHRSVKIPSNVDVGTITVIVSRDALWMDVTQRLGETEIENYHRVASCISYGEQVYKWIHRYMPNARIVVSVEPTKPGEPVAPSYVGLSPNFPDQSEVVKRVMNMMKDLADNPGAWLVTTGGPEHVRIGKKHGEKS